MISKMKHSNDSNNAPSTDPSATEETGETDSLETCTACGAPVETSTWHPVTSYVDDDGEYQIRAFCSQACRDAWHDE